MSHLIDIPSAASDATLASGSVDGHAARAQLLAAVLHTLRGAKLPKVDSWSTSARGFHLDPGSTAPEIVGSFYGLFSLSSTRAAVGAWALALGTEPVETIKGTTVTISARVGVRGVDIGVTGWISLSSACPDCGGPATRTEVYRHYADTCGGAK